MPRQKRIEVIVDIDMMPSGERYFRMTSLNPAVEIGSGETYTEEGLIEALGLGYRDRVKITFEVIGR